jgi:hypothetical protein
VKQFGDKLDQAFLRRFKEVDDLVVLGLQQSHAMMILSFVLQQPEEYDLDNAAFQAAPQFICGY